MYLVMYTTFMLRTVPGTSAITDCYKSTYAFKASAQTDKESNIYTESKICQLNKHHCNAESVECKKTLSCVCTNVLSGTRPGH